MHRIVFMTSLYIHYTLSFVLNDHSVHDEPSFVLTHVFMHHAHCLLSSLLVLTLTMQKLHHWPSIISMLSQGLCGNEDD